MLEAQRLRKRYGERTAVDEVSLRVERGEIVGLLGPNGAGKSTTISMLAGLATPDGGEVRIGGEPVRAGAPAAKRRIGLAPQELALLDDLSARTNLQVFGALYGLAGRPLEAGIARALAQVGLADRAGEAPSRFSGGMKRRLNIAAALVHDPEVLLLDEPTAGVDPQSRHAIFEHLLALKAAGKALLYTTHHMDEVERLCDRVVIVDHGRVVAEGTLASLRALLPAPVALDLVVDGAVDTAALQRETPATAVTLRDGALRIELPELTHAAARVLEWLGLRGHAVTRVATSAADLEQVFLHLTGHALRD